MDKKSTGPYQYYERPTKKRSSQDKPLRRSGRWGAVIIVLVIILIALIPVVHRLASSHSEKAEELKTVKKVSSKKISKATKSAKTKKTSSSALKNSAKASSSSSSSNQDKPSTYVVKTGDTLTGIAEKYGMTVDQLAKLNNLNDSSNINIGQTLKLR